MITKHRQDIVNDHVLLDPLCTPKNMNNNHLDTQTSTAIMTSTSGAVSVSVSSSPYESGMFPICC